MVMSGGMPALLCLLVHAVSGTGSAGKPRRVLVVGGGVSGIAATHYFSQDPANEVHMIDSASDVGGVWKPTLHYPNLQTNSARESFVLPDLASDPDANDFPTTAEVNEYLRRYVAKFDLRKLMVFNTTVTRISRVPAGTAQFGYTFKAEFNREEVAEALGVEFDFVVVATGDTSLKHMPEIPTKGFKGQFVHSSDIIQEIIPGSLDGKRVVVLGSGKSAQDSAVFASNSGASEVHVLMRETHWGAPRYIGNESPDKGEYNYNVLYSRFAQAFLPTCPDCFNSADQVPWGQWFLHQTTLGGALRDAFWGGVLGDIIKQYSIPEWLIPPTPFLKDMRHIHVLQPEFIPKVSAGKIHAHLCTTIDNIDGAEVHLKNLTDCTVPDLAPPRPEKIDADVIIFGTGWKNSIKALLSDEMYHSLVSSDGVPNLYKHTFNPNLPGVGFVGFCYNSENTFLWASLSSRWLAEYAKGTDGAIYRNGVLTNMDEVWRHIYSSANYSETFSTGQTARGRVLGLATHPAVDGMMADLGLEHYRQPSWVAELTAPYNPTLYAELDVELSQGIGPTRDPTAMLLGAGLALLLALYILSTLVWRCLCGAKSASTKAKTA